jgi:endonuclease YncB( thermonuclease family)
VEIMRRVLSAAALLLLCGVTPFLPVTSVAAQDTVSCASYDAWEWAQSVFESDKSKYRALDADGDGTACPELPRGGFAPAFWTDTMPTEVQEATIVRIIDGDTLEVLIDDVSNRVRIYRADTPETQNEQHCGGTEATDYATWALSLSDTPNVVYLEKDKTEKDRYGRELAYVWFTVGGQPYMLNHILITNGWAEDIDYGDRTYDAQLKQAAAFARTHELGVYDLCGGFGKPLPAQPTQPPALMPAPTELPRVPQEPVSAPSGGCDPNYTGCVPVVSHDLDCADIGFMVQVIGVDIHGFDREGDGLGCESYG